MHACMQHRSNIESTKAANLRLLKQLLCIISRQCLLQIDIEQRGQARPGARAYPPSLPLSFSAIAPAGLGTRTNSNSCAFTNLPCPAPCRPAMPSPVCGTPLYSVLYCTMQSCCLLVRVYAALACRSPFCRACTM